MLGKMQPTLRPDGQTNTNATGNRHLHFTGWLHRCNSVGFMEQHHNELNCPTKASSLTSKTLQVTCACRTADTLLTHELAISL